MSLSAASWHDAEHDLSFAISAAKSALCSQLLKMEWDENVLCKQDCWVTV